MYGLLPQGFPQFLLEAIDFGGLPYHVAPHSHTGDPGKSSAATGHPLSIFG
jgi:hypothetical protein